MSRRVHTVVQSVLLVLWVVVLVADNARSVSCQDCSVNPPYTLTNPTQFFWNETIGNVTVKMDEQFLSQYPAIVSPNAKDRIEAGHRGWNNIGLCASINFVDFGTRSFTEAEKNTQQPPFGTVYWVVADPQIDSYAGSQPVIAGNRVVAGIVRVRPSGYIELSKPYAFYHLGSHEWTLI